MKTYVFGHKRPDTDSVCSAIAYAYLKKQLGIDAEARVLGDINLETKYVLNRFNIPEVKAVRKVIELNQDISWMEQKEMFFQGIRESYYFLQKIKGKR